MAGGMSYAVYLINLDRAVSRLKLMEDELRAAGIHDYQRVAAVDGQRLTEHDFIIRNRFKKEISPGEIGCFLSHVKTMQSFVASSLDYAVVLEDDAKLKAQFKQVVELVLSQSKDLDAGIRWDVLKLYNGTRRNIFVDRVSEEYFIGSCGTSIPSRTVGAIWTREGARRFLDKVMQNGAPVIGRPIDCELQHPWEYDLTIFNLLPSITDSLDVPTQIQLRSERRKSKIAKIIKYELARLMPKYRYYLKRHGWSRFFRSFILHENDLVP